MVLEFMRRGHPLRGHSVSTRSPSLRDGEGLAVIYASSSDASFSAVRRWSAICSRALARFCTGAFRTRVKDVKGPLRVDASIAMSWSRAGEVGDLFDAAGVDEFVFHHAAKDLHLDALPLNRRRQRFYHAGDIVISDDVGGWPVDDGVDVADTDLVGRDLDEVIFGDEDSAAAFDDIAPQVVHLSSVDV